jgi:predicted dienelactone hydrolase
MGGYTALALAGGRPTPTTYDQKDNAMQFPAGFPTSFPASFKDERVKALVLLAPATVWFRESHAPDVQVPILMMTAEQDTVTPSFHPEIIKNGLPEETLLEHKIISGAGHFSFLSPFPPAMVKPTFTPSQDPSGFDRPAFHQQMNTDVLRFLKSRC